MLKAYLHVSAHLFFFFERLYDQQDSYKVNCQYSDTSDKVVDEQYIQLLCNAYMVYSSC